MGRPREFDPAVAIDRAMDVFWSQGFSATTPQQLADRLQIAKGSMYHAFGGKRELYDLALRRYLDLRVETVGAMLNENIEQRTGPDGAPQYSVASLIDYMRTQRLRRLSR